MLDTEEISASKGLNMGRGFDLSSHQKPFSNDPPIQPFENILKEDDFNDISHDTESHTYLENLEKNRQTLDFTQAIGYSRKGMGSNSINHMDEGLGLNEKVQMKNEYGVENDKYELNLSQGQVIPFIHITNGSVEINPDIFEVHLLIISAFSTI